MTEEKENKNPIVSLGELLREGVSVGSLATAVNDKNFSHYDQYGRFLPADEAGRIVALKLLEDMYRWSVDDYDSDYGDLRSPLELYDVLERNPFDAFGWCSEQVPDLDKVNEDNSSFELASNGVSKHNIPDKFVKCLIITLVEMAKRATEKGIDFDPMRIPGTKEYFCNVLIKLNNDAEYALSTFKKYAKNLCSFQSGPKGDIEFYRKLFPEYFK